MALPITILRTLKTLNSSTKKNRQTIQKAKQNPDSQYINIVGWTGFTFVAYNNEVYQEIKNIDNTNFKSMKQELTDNLEKLESELKNVELKEEYQQKIKFDISEINTKLKELDDLESKNQSDTSLKRFASTNISDVEKHFIPLLEKEFRNIVKGITNSSRGGIKDFEIIDTNFSLAKDAKEDAISIESKRLSDSVKKWVKNYGKEFMNDFWGEFTSKAFGKGYSIAYPEKKGLTPDDVSSNIENSIKFFEKSDLKRNPDLEIFYIRFKWTLKSRDSYRKMMVSELQNEFKLYKNKYYLVTPNKKLFKFIKSNKFMSTLTYWDSIKETFEPLNKTVKIPEFHASIIYSQERPDTFNQLR
jgi:hypothetical protein